VGWGGVGGVGVGGGGEHGGRGKEGTQQLVHIQMLPCPGAQKIRLRTIDKCAASALPMHAC
jgi:hypothetical protein